MPATSWKPWGTAAGYDDASADMYAQEILQTCGGLPGLAPSERALEFAGRTGRVVLTLSASAVGDSGIDSSEPMAEVLRMKPGASEIEVIMGARRTIEAVTGRL